MSQLAQTVYDREDWSSVCVSPVFAQRNELCARWGMAVQRSSSGIVRLRGDGAIARLDTTLVRLGRGIVLGIGHADIKAPISVEDRNSGTVIFSVLTSGCLYFGGPDPKSVRSGQCVLRLQEPGDVTTCQIPDSQHVAGIRIAFDAEQVAVDFKLPGGAPALRRMLRGIQVYDVEATTQRLLDNLEHVSLDGPTALLSLEGLCLQLLANAIERVSRRNSPIIVPLADPLSVSQLPPRSAKFARSAYQLISLYYDNPPSIGELARRVGTNPHKLGRCFKALFGESVTECALRMRMERARRLLMEESLGVAEVGYRVGYKHHSSFTAAFSGFFGTAPTAIRRQEELTH